MSDVKRKRRKIENYDDRKERQEKDEKFWLRKRGKKYERI